MHRFYNEQLPASRLKVFDRRSAGKEYLPADALPPGAIVTPGTNPIIQVGTREDGTPIFKRRRGRPPRQQSATPIPLEPVQEVRGVREIGPISDSNAPTSLNGDSTGHLSHAHRGQTTSVTNSKRDWYSGISIPPPGLEEPLLPDAEDDHRAAVERSQEHGEPDRSEEENERWQLLSSFGDVVFHLPIELYRSCAFIRKTNSEYMCRVQQMDNLCLDLQGPIEESQAVLVRQTVLRLARAAKEDRQEAVAEIFKLQNAVETQISSLCSEIERLEGPKGNDGKPLEPARIAASESTPIYVKPKIHSSPHIRLKVIPPQAPVEPDRSVVRKRGRRDEGPVDPLVSSPLRKRTVREARSMPEGHDVISTTVSSAPEEPVAALIGVSLPRLRERVPEHERPLDVPIDDDEPLYCYCQRVSFGKMIACENEQCQGGEWFHFPCLGINTAPHGKWYCDTCRKLGIDRVANTKLLTRSHRAPLTADSETTRNEAVQDNTSVTPRQKAQLRRDAALEKRDRIRHENRERERLRRLRLKSRR